MGIGGLLALCLRARGELVETPLILQGPILWGLERRWMPKLMRLRPAQAALLRIFAAAPFQRRFVRKYFVRQPAPATVAAFFDGYARCSAAPDFFAWLNPALLRALEREFAARPAALERIHVWWGGRDRVVTLRELDWTQQALGTADRWPLRVFSDWGHYPMIDEPERWSKALSKAAIGATPPPADDPPELVDSSPDPVSSLPAAADSLPEAVNRMARPVRWRPLERFQDRTVPKLDNLRRAAAAGLRVPETWWMPAAEAAKLDTVTPPFLLDRPLIIRSGSPTEDTRITSNAGQLLSLAVRDPNAFGESLARVVAALPQDGRGKPQGAIFVQPLVEAEEAGVAFFDGFYWERTLAAGGNEELTSGRARGEVSRGHLQRQDPWSEWLTSVHRPFHKKMPRIDLELARDGRGWILLQVRPALFPVARNETLSLANHREILGDPPSPWIASALAAAGRPVLSFFAAADPEVAAWEESYAIGLAERAWMSFSFFFRLMDNWGLPRTFVTQGVGGEGGGPADGRLLFGRFVRKSPRLVRLQLQSLATIARAGRELSELDRRIAAASGLADLHRITVEGLALAVRTNFAIGGVLTGVSQVRRFLGIRGAARVVTREMMEEYGRLASFADPSAREAALDDWLARYGHRGPLESDPVHPRFAELRDVLLRDLASSGIAATPPSPEQRKPSWLTRPFYRIDEIRERFRDDLMRRWQRLRVAILEEGRRLVAAGELDAPEDVFWLRGEDLEGGSFRQAVAAGRERVQRASCLDLPLTDSREEIERAVVRSEQIQAEASGRRVFPGIALGPAVVEGRAVKADDLVSLLGRPGDLGPDAILVVPALEPSWAVVFPRVGGVVAEIGGELSHASILLREARRPAIVNCAGIWRAVSTGDRLRLDGRRAVVEVVRSVSAKAAS